LAILNPRFAFLENDFENNNLKVNKPKRLQHKNPPKPIETQSVSNESIKPPLTFATIYYKSVPMFVYVYVVPADIYCAALFLFIRNL